MMSLRHLFVLAPLLAACGGDLGTEEPPINPSPVEARPAESITIHVETDSVPWLTAPDFRARFDRTVVIAKEYWGVTNLGEVTVVFTDTPCTSYDGGGWGGCAYRTRLEPAAWTIELDPRSVPGSGACIEGSALVHEIGHLTFWDPRHEDPRWDGLLPLWWNVLQPLCSTEDAS